MPFGFFFGNRNDGLDTGSILIAGFMRSSISDLTQKSRPLQAGSIAIIMNHYCQRDPISRVGAVSNGYYSQPKHWGSDFTTATYQKLCQPFFKSWRSALMQTLSRGIFTQHGGNLEMSGDNLNIRSTQLRSWEGRWNMCFSKCCRYRSAWAKFEVVEQCCIFNKRS